MEQDSVKMLKISFALNFFGKIFGNKLKINFADDIFMYN